VATCGRTRPRLPAFHLQRLHRGSGVHRLHLLSPRSMHTEPCRQGLEFSRPEPEGEHTTTRPAPPHSAQHSNAAPERVRRCQRAFALPPAAHTALLVSQPLSPPPQAQHDSRTRHKRSHPAESAAAGLLGRAACPAPQWRLPPAAHCLGPQTLARHGDHCCHPRASGQSQDDLPVRQGAPGCCRRLVWLWGDSGAAWPAQLAASKTAPPYNIRKFSQSNLAQC
jgi:hypothetical protein